MRLLLPFAAWLALGLPCAALFWRRGRRELALAVLPFAGALALVLPLIAIAPLGASLAHWPVGALLSSLLLPLCVRPLLRGAPAASAAPPRDALGAALAVFALAGSALLLLAAGAALARGWPGYGWDGLSIWLVRAKVLARSVDLPVALFAEPSLAHGHWDYPLLLPALLAWFARGADLQLRELALPLGIVAAVFPPALALGLRRILPAPAAAALALSPFAVPALAVYHFHAYADPLLVLFVATGLAWTFAGAIRRDPDLVVAGGLALACAVATKNEGALWGLAAAAGATCVARAAGASWRAAGGVCLRSALPALVVFLAWRAACARLGVIDTLPQGLRFDLLATRAPELAISLLRFVSQPAQGPVLVACAAIAFALAGGDARARLLRAGALLAAPALYTAGMALVYLATPHELGWHVATSLPRTLFGLLPACLVALVLAPSLARAAAR